MAISGSDKKITLWNKEGVLIGTIGEMKSWCWGVTCKPNDKMIFGADNNGQITMFKTEFNTVHGLY